MTDDIVAQAWSMGPDARPLKGAEIAEALEAPDCAWVHLDAKTDGTAEWVETHLAYLPAPVRAALLDRETRPRFSSIGNGVLLILRGVNLNPGAEPHDMISIRIWADPSRVVTLTLRELRTVDEVAAEFRAGQAPRTAGEFVTLVAERIAEKITEALLTLDAESDRIEDALLTRDEEGLRPRINRLRQTIAEFRRFLGAQQEALTRLVGTAPPGLFTADERLRLVEVDDDARRDAEIVASINERLVVFRDELEQMSDARLNRNLYILSVVSAIFLPLGFLTGLMGINLDGMPGADWEPAFWVFTGALCALAVVLIVILWRLRFVRTRR